MSDRYLTTDVGDDGGPEPQTLSEVSFTDIFFAETGRCFLRGGESDQPLWEPPHTVLSEIEILHQIVCERGSRDPEFALEFAGMRFRVTRIEAEDGLWYTLRRAMWPIPRIGALPGIPPKVLQTLVSLGSEGKTGLILVCGATGAGKTTTASALLREWILQYGNVARTIEDPPELPMNGPCGRFGHIFQGSVPPNGSYTTEMVKVLRQSPRYILLGEIREEGAANQVLRASINGHVVISTVHAGSCIEGLEALLKISSNSGNVEGARSILAQGIAGVIHQQLIKTRDLDGRPSSKISMQWLFPGNDPTVRTLIRSGKTEQLVTALEQQSNRVKSGQFPVG